MQLGVTSPLSLDYDDHGDGLDKLAWTPNPMLLKKSSPAISTTVVKLLTDTVNKNYKLHKGSIFFLQGTVLDRTGVHDSIHFLNIVYMIRFLCETYLQWDHRDKGRDFHKIT